MKVEKAYAKINLHLEVLSKRLDGYHDIQSVMASLNLADILTFDKLESNTTGEINISFTASGKYKEIFDELPVKKNLVYKAVEKYLEKSGFGVSFSINIEKNIPAGAGLGGGSSDAAAVLRYLNDSFKLYKKDELIVIASAVGADVPFCLEPGIALCTGIGEVIERLDSVIPYQVVLVNDDIHVNTGNAYNYMDKVLNKKTPEVEKNEIISIINKGMLDVKNICFINDFEIAVFEQFPKVKEIKNRISDEGAVFTLMTGSGSTIFGLFEDSISASKTVEVMSDTYSMVLQAEFI